ncbi:hypothetical protein niasHS_002888 [Heterodera schachtii]|uniref:SUN domain-containing protein n=1 Tax=Heterodera schachtii TaxID=97005 RepID=A0ABD2K9B0_HETSC
MHQKRMSFSPGPSDSRTPTPMLRAGSSASTSSRLSKEEIDEILDSPYETRYTYSDSAAYKPHIGSHDYVHPRLCRRFPATQIPRSTSPPFLTYPTGTWQNYWRRPDQWTWTQLFFYAVQFFAIFAYTVIQYTLVRVYYAFRYLTTRAAWYAIKYTILWPILAPYYAAVSYYNKARFVWRTTHNVWTVISWTFAWLTGQRRYAAQAASTAGDAAPPRYYSSAAVDGTPPSSTSVGGVRGVGLRTRAMSRLREQQMAGEDAAAFAATHSKNDAQQQHIGKWLFYALLVLLLLFSGYTLYGDRRFRLAGGNKTQQQQSVEEMVPQIHGKPDQEQLLKLKPSDELHQTHLAQPGTPKKDIVMDQPELHLTPSLHPSPPPLRGEVPIADEILPQPQFIYNTTTSYSFYEHLTRAGQSVWELIVDTFIGTYELLKRIFFVIVSMPIKFAKMFAHFMRAVVSSVWLSLKWLAEQIVGIPFTFVASLKEAVQFRMQNFANSVTEFGQTVYRKVAEWFTMLPNAIHEHFLSMWQAVRWMVFQFSHTLFIVFDGIGYAGQKVLDGCIYAYNAFVSSMHWLFSKITNTLFFVGESVVNLCGFVVDQTGRTISLVRDSAVNVTRFTVEKIGNAIFFVWHNAAHLFRSGIEKIGSAIFFVWDNVAHLFQSGFAKIGNAFIFVRDDVTNLFWKTVEKVWNAILFVRNGVVVVVWGTIEKIYTVLSVLIRSIAHFFTSAYNAFAGFVLGVWHSVRYSPPATKVEELLNKAQEIKDEGLPSDDHPLIQHFHRILTATLAEERTALEKRLRELAQQQQQSSASAILPTPTIDGNALKDNLRKELDLKLRVEKEEINKTVNHFEEQIMTKLRTLIEQMHSQKDVLEHEIDEVRKTQLELKKDVEETGKPLLKKEKITQQLKEDGRTETIKESTVLIAQKQQQQAQIGHQFDEGALLEKVRRMIREELRRFDADRTGIVDYALESSGGSVLSTRCTVQYNERSRVQKLFGFPLWYTGYSPRTVIQRKGYGASTGECWAFYGGHGYLTIGLSQRINVTAVSYEHLPVEMSPDKQIRSAPRNFLVWSYQDVDELDTRLLLGNFTYDAEGGEPLQMFPVQQWDPHGTQIVELETLTNWGSQVTCLYRFRVHGDKMREIPEVASADDLAAFDSAKRWPESSKHKEIGGG